MFTAHSKDAMKDEAFKRGQNVSEELRDGVRRVKQDVKDIKDDLGDTVDAVKDDLQAVARQAGKQVRQLAESTEETIVAKINENPLTSVLVALGAGFVVGAFLRRS